MNRTSDWSVVNQFGDLFCTNILYFRNTFWNKFCHNNSSSTTEPLRLMFRWAAELWSPPASSRHKTWSQKQYSVPNQFRYRRLNDSRISREFSVWENIMTSDNKNAHFTRWQLPFLGFGYVMVCAEKNDHRGSWADQRFTSCQQASRQELEFVLPLQSAFVWHARPEARFVFELTAPCAQTRFVEPRIVLSVRHAALRWRSNNKNWKFTDRLLNNWNRNYRLYYWKQPELAQYYYNYYCIRH